ncbi:MAG: LysM peptidoglycan-binding domain-containing protein [Chloroflexota bacterium]|nr:LysM peptidoglycan-binding domain-containing protein [Chloroflexota bacterium]
MAGHLEVKNSISIGIVAGLIASMVLFGVALTSLISARQERAVFEGAYESTISSIEHIRAAQQSPEALRQRIAEAEGDLEALLATVPTRREVRAEIVRYYTYASNVDAELVRIGKVATSSKEKVEGIYERQRFLLEAQGMPDNLMRFLARVGSGPYSTFILANIRIRPNGPATADADLEVFSSELSGVASPFAPSAVRMSSKEGNLGLEDEAVVALSDDLQEAIIAGRWEDVVSLGERFLGLGMGSEDVKAAIYQGYVRVGYDLLSQGAFAEAGEHFQRALDIVPHGQEAQEGLEALGGVGGTEEGDPGSDMLSDSKVHVVRRGESLSVLAQRYNTTVQEIMELNDLHRTTIYVGQQILVPAR